MLAKAGGVRDSDPFDPLKYVPLTRTGAVWIGFGGQLRERFEVWNQFNFGAPVTAVHNDNFLYTRLMLHADLHVGTHVRVFVQEKNSFSTHRSLLGGQRTSDVDELDLQNGFVDIRLPVGENSRLTLRAGRQEISLGRERFVGVSDWSNVRRTWDGFSGNLETGKSALVFFWARPVKINKYEFNRPDSATQFYGVHLNRKLPPRWGTMEVYWYGLENRLASYNGTTGEESRHVIGGHDVNQIGRTGFDYDLGGSIQVGSIGNQGILAHGIVTQLGYTLRQKWSAPRFYVGYDYASGDRQPGGDVGTFNLLFPTSHSTLGFADVVGRQNMQDVNCGVALAPARKWRIRLDGFAYWRASLNDNFYDKRGNVIRASSPGLPRKLGEEADLTLRYQWDAHTVVQSGYSHFFPGAFFRQSGPHESLDFFYISLQFTF
ncbi:MAG: alginate export family protein [Terriglobia bacterium]